MSFVDSINHNNIARPVAEHDLQKKLVPPPLVRFETSSLGEFVVEFDGVADCPVAVASVIDLVRQGYYDGMKIHRVVPNFGIQFGCSFARDDSDRDLWGRGGALPHSGFVLPNGTQAMRDRSGFVPCEHRSARSVVKTVAVPCFPEGTAAASHLFVNLKSNPTLDTSSPVERRVVVIGEVTGGWEVLQRMEAVEINELQQPVDSIVIRKATILRE